MYEIVLTPGAADDLRALTGRDRQTVTGEIEKQLKHDPDKPTRNRKRLSPNQLAEWELRVGKFRVFYDVQVVVKIVKVVAIGHKDGNRLFVHGEEFEL